ncbi:hypothetical protein [Kingella kingae]|uniref:hypothetical protein n=1 Tax=Kingella kingae TaxID=504 RepID=UPI00254B3B98|nr:hypothetical protein [Kingella kingae]MDK4586946.1 hypothetical protein [Kingella kingae]MDK4630776.1 hypothetical protein [Kingella kingae]
MEKNKIIDFLQKNASANTMQINEYLGKDAVTGWAQTRLLLDEMASSGEIIVKYCDGFARFYPL